MEQYTRKSYSLLRMVQRLTDKYNRYTQIWFGLRCFFPIWRDWNISYTRKGRAKAVSQRAAKTVFGLFVLVTFWRARQSDRGFSYVSDKFLSLPGVIGQAAQRLFTQ